MDFPLNARPTPSRARRVFLAVCFVSTVPSSIGAQDAVASQQTIPLFGAIGRGVPYPSSLLADSEGTYIAFDPRVNMAVVCVSFPTELDCTIENDDLTSAVLFRSTGFDVALFATPNTILVIDPYGGEDLVDVTVGCVAELRRLVRDAFVSYDASIVQVTTEFLSSNSCPVPMLLRSQ